MRVSRSGKQVHEEGGRDAGRGEETCQKLPLLGEPRTAAPPPLQPTHSGPSTLSEPRAKKLNDIVRRATGRKNIMRISTLFYYT